MSLNTVTEVHSHAYVVLILSALKRLKGKAFTSSQGRLFYNPFHQVIRKKKIKVTLSFYFHCFLTPVHIFQLWFAEFLNGIARSFFPLSVGYVTHFPLLRIKDTWHWYLYYLFVSSWLPSKQSFTFPLWATRFSLFP